MRACSVPWRKRRSDGGTKRRGDGETNVSLSPSVVSKLLLLSFRGVDAEAAARTHLTATYRRFMAEADPERKGEAGKDLIRAIFGKDSVAEDSVF